MSKINKIYTVIYVLITIIFWFTIFSWILLFGALDEGGQEVIIKLIDGIFSENQFPYFSFISINLGLIWYGLIYIGKKQEANRRENDSSLEPTENMISSFGNRKFKHQFVVWDLEQNDISELISQTFPKYNRERSDVYEKFLVDSVHTGRKSYDLSFILVLLTLLSMILLDYLISGTWISYFGFHMFVTLLLIFLVPTIIFSKENKKLRVKYADEDDITNSTDFGFGNLFSSPILESAIVYVTLFTCLILEDLSEKFILIPVVVIFLFMIFLISNQFNKKILNELLPINLISHDKSIFILLFQSKQAYNNVFQTRDYTFGIFSTRIVEQIFQSQGTKNGIASLNLYTLVSNTKWKKFNIPFKLKYYISPILTSLLIFIISKSLLFSIIDNLYLFSIFIILIMEVMFLLIGWIDMKYVLNNSLKTLRYIIKNRIVPRNIIEMDLNWVRAVNKDINIELQKLSNSKYWARRFGVITLDEIIKYNRDVELFLKEH